MVSILFLLIYGLSSSGMTIQFHYCCGKLKEVTLSTVSEKHCGMEHSSLSKKKCCDDKQVELKIKSDQRTEQASKLSFAVPALSKQETEISSDRPVVSKKIVPEIFASPPLQNPLYIFYCIYRI